MTSLRVAAGVSRRSRFGECERAFGRRRRSLRLGGARVGEPERSSNSRRPSYTTLRCWTHPAEGGPIPYRRASNGVAAGVHVRQAPAKVHEYRSGSAGGREIPARLRTFRRSNCANPVAPGRDTAPGDARDRHSVDGVALMYEHIRDWRRLWLDPPSAARRRCGRRAAEGRACASRRRPAGPDRGLGSPSARRAAAGRGSRRRCSLFSTRSAATFKRRWTACGCLRTTSIRPCSRRWGFARRCAAQRRPPASR